MTSSSTNITVCIDTMILVWGIRKDGPDEKLKRAQWLFQELDRDHATIIIPAIVATEYLNGVEPEDQNKVLSELSQRFFIAPFDAKCAPLAADLWRKGSQGRTKSTPDARKTLRADTLIVASARAHGAMVFYSGDENCRKLADKAGMSVKDLPTIAPDLFS